MLPRTLAIALCALPLSACATDDVAQSTGDVEQQGNAVEQPNALNDRWFAEGNTITVFTPHLDPSDPASPVLSNAKWLQALAAMQDYNAKTSLHFVSGCHVTGKAQPSCDPPDDGRAHLLLGPWGIHGGHTWSLSSLDIDLGNRTTEALAAEPWKRRLQQTTDTRHEDFLILFFDDPTEDSKVGFEHEFGHAYGLNHEQSRSDAATEVDVFPCCIRDAEEPNFNVQPNAMFLSAYDVDSVMQYRSWDFADGCDPVRAKSNTWNRTPVTSPPNHTTCTARDANGDSVEPSPPQMMTFNDFRINDAPGLSVEDINTVFQMYPPTLGDGAMHPGDRYGAASAAGDFDADGYDDLAVGAPLADGTDGAVFLYKGTFTGLITWRRIASPNPGTHGRFGSALAVDQIAGDSTDDLVVGEPNAAAESVANAGRVHVFTGARVAGLSRRGSFTAPTPVTNGLFGGVLGTGDFNGDGIAQIIVGQPARHLVQVFTTTVGPFVTTLNTTWGGQQTQDFGAAVTAGDLTGDGLDDLVVGAPNQPAGGRVFVMPGSASAMFTGTLQQVNNPLATAGEQFGTAVAVVSPSLRDHRLVFGAPNARGGRGAAWVFGLGITTPQELHLSQFGIADAGSRFGAALAVGDTSGSGDEHLMVGASVAGGSSGRVGFYRFSGGTFVAGQFFGRWDGDVANDGFGSSMAVGKFDKRNPVGVAIGGPGFFGNTGEIYIVHGRAGQAAEYIATNPNPGTDEGPFNNENTSHLDESANTSIELRRGIP